MSLVDIKTITETARAEVAKEDAEKAKAALVKKYRELSAAKKVVQNVEREVADLEASIADGSFAG